MGNIVSYFFPQPAPASIEQVQEVVQDEKKTVEVMEEPVAAIIEEVAVVDDIITAEAVEEPVAAIIEEVEVVDDIITAEAVEEPVAAVTEAVAVVEDIKTTELVVDKEIKEEVQTDEGFEVVEESALSEVTNTHQSTHNEAQPESFSSKELSPGPAVTDADETEKETQADNEANISQVEMVETTPEDKIELLKEPVCINLHDVEVIGSIQDENIEPKDELDEKAPILEQEKVLAEAPATLLPEPVKVSTPEPTEILPEPIKAATPEPAAATIAPEPAIAPVPKELTPEPVKISTPEVEVIGSISEDDVVKGEEMPELPTAISPQPEEAQINTETDKEIEPKTEAAVKDVSPDVELPVEVPGGASGLKDLLTEPIKLEE